MIDSTIFDIKFCLLLVFLIGLITGYFFIRRVTKEEYIPVMERFKKSAKQNFLEIKENEQKITENNNKISQIREDIKKHKESVSSIEESLLNTEHLYSKQSSITDKLLKEIEDSYKIEKSLKKELKYYQDIIHNQSKIKDENIELKKEIHILEQKLSDIKSDIGHNKDLTKQIEQEIEMLNNELLDKKHDLKTLEERYIDKKSQLEKNPILSKGIELDKINNELTIYKNKILEIKSKT